MMSEFVYADPKRKPLVAQTTETPEKQTAPLNVETSSLVDLQRVLGNQGLQRLLAQRKIQAKLTVGAADDQYEVEADNVAKQVMSAASVTEGVQRESPEEEEMMLKRADIQRESPDEEEMMLKRADIQRESLDEEEMMLKRADIQRSSADLSGSFDVDDNVENQINGMKGGGQALPGASKDFFESSFGQDFGDVRVHASSEADSLNRSIGARAFTQGTDIFMRPNEFSPDSTSGRELLAHELTHVVQQTGGKEKAQTKRDDE
jgi:hypothetical protein